MNKRRNSKKQRNTVEKCLVPRRFEPGAPNPKSAMLAPRPQIDENCLKNQKNFGYMFSNSKFFKFLVMNYETSIFSNVQET